MLNGQDDGTAQSAGLGLGRAVLIAVAILVASIVMVGGMAYAFLDVAVQQATEAGR